MNIQWTNKTSSISSPLAVTWWPAQVGQQKRPFNNSNLCATGCCGSLGFGSKISLRRSLNRLNPISISISATGIMDLIAASRPSIRRGSWVRSSVSPGDWRLGPRPSAARSGVWGIVKRKKRPTLQIFNFFEQIFEGVIIHIMQENAVGIFGNVRGKNIIPHIQSINVEYVEYVEYIKIHQRLPKAFRIFIF